MVVEEKFETNTKFKMTELFTDAVNAVVSPSDVGSDGYTGPYISDNKFQTSTEFGEHEAKEELAYLSRMHDTAYAHFEDRNHREAADRLYNERAKELVGRFPHLAGNAVMYGNYAKRQFEDGLGYASWGPLGLAYWAGKNMVNANKMLNGTYLKKETGDVLDLYQKDPQAEKYEKWAYGKGGSGPVKGGPKRGDSSTGQMQTRQQVGTAKAENPSVRNAVDPQGAKSLQRQRAARDLMSGATSSGPNPPALTQALSKLGAGQPSGWFSRRKNKVHVHNVDEHKKYKTRKGKTNKN